MSKLVKQSLMNNLQRRLEGVDALFVVDVIGLDANSTAAFRKELRDASVNLLVVNNRLAARATEGTVLAPAFESLSGSAAIAWGGEDVVALAKTVVKAVEKPEYEAAQAKGGVLDGSALSAEDVKAVSKWPSRLEQLSILSGQLIGPASTLSAQLVGPGGVLAGQIAQQAEGDDSEAAAA